MRKRLPALLSFMLSALLLGSCGKDSYKDNSVLILADSLMQTYPLTVHCNCWKEYLYHRKWGKRTGHGMRYY